MYGLLGFDNIWPRCNYLKIWNLRVQNNLNIEKIAFKVVQMKLLAIYITNQKLSFDILIVGLGVYRMVHGQVPNGSGHPHPLGVGTLEWTGHVRVIMKSFGMHLVKVAEIVGTLEKSNQT